MVEVVIVVFVVNGNSSGNGCGNDCGNDCGYGKNGDGSRAFHPHPFWSYTFFHLIAYLQIYLLPYLCLSVVRFVTTGTGKTLMARQIGKMLNTREPKIISGPGKFD